MSVIINGMNMPRNCDECPLLYDDMECSITTTSVSFEQQMSTRLHDCPLKPANEMIRSEAIVVLNNLRNYYGIRQGGEKNAQALDFAISSLITDELNQLVKEKSQ